MPRRRTAHSPLTLPSFGIADMMEATSFGMPGSHQLSQRKNSNKYGSTKGKKKRPQSGNNANTSKRKKADTSAEMASQIVAN